MREAGEGAAPSLREAVPRGRGEQPGQRWVGGHPNQPSGHHIALPSPVDSFARAAEDFVSVPLSESLSQEKRLHPQGGNGLEEVRD